MDKYPRGSDTCECCRGLDWRTHAGAPLRTSVENQESICRLHVIAGARAHVLPCSITCRGGLVVDGDAGCVDASSFSQCINHDFVWSDLDDETRARVYRVINRTAELATYHTSSFGC